MFDQLIIAVGLGLGACLLYVGLRPRVRERVLFEFPLLVLVAMLGGAAALLFSMNDPDFPTSMVTGLLVAGAALFGLFFNAAVARADAERLRQERRDDVQRALVAEIRHYYEVFSGTEFDDIWQDMYPRIEKGYVPFLPSDKSNTVFESVLPDIHVLPKHVIDPVVQHYSQLKAIEAAVEDSRLEPFTAGKGPEFNNRRKTMYYDYLGLRKRTLRNAEAALSALGVDLDQINKDTVNNLDGGRSDP